MHVEILVKWQEFEKIVNFEDWIAVDGPVGMGMIVLAISLIYQQRLTNDASMWIGH